jgi:hypothetical protein
MGFSTDFVELKIYGAISARMLSAARLAVAVNTVSSGNGSMAGTVSDNTVFSHLIADGARK